MSGKSSAVAPSAAKPLSDQLPDSRQRAHLIRRKSGGIRFLPATQFLSPVLENPHAQNATSLVPSYIVRRASWAGRGLSEVFQVLLLPRVLISGICILTSALSGFPRPPDYWGNPCPLNGPCSSTRNSHRDSAGRSGRSCRRNGARSSPCNRPTNSSRARPRPGSCNSTTSSRSPAQSPAPGQSVDIAPAPDKLNPDGERARQRQTSG